MRFAHCWKPYCEMQNSNKSAFILYLISYWSVRAGLKPNKATAKGIALQLSTLGCSSTHNNTLQVLQRTTIGPAPPKYSSTCEKMCVTASFHLYHASFHLYHASFYLYYGLFYLYQAAFTCTTPWKWPVMYVCVMGIDFDFVSTIFFLYDFGSVPTLWYRLFFSFHFNK
jgi:hypothetical protein